MVWEGFIYIIGRKTRKNWSVITMKKSTFFMIVMIFDILDVIDNLIKAEYHLLVIDLIGVICFFLLYRYHKKKDTYFDW